MPSAGISLRDSVSLSVRVACLRSIARAIAKTRGRERDETFPPYILTFGNGCCFASGRVGHRKGANLPVAPYHHCRALPCGWADLILRPEKDVPSRVRARATGKVEYRNANAYSLRQLLANAAIAASRVAS
jgi:hypothetical protein